jgi:hypothetical protein
MTPARSEIHSKANSSRVWWPVLDAASASSGVLAFLQGAYEAGARLAGWETSGFESKRCPTPGQLHQLQATGAYEFGRPEYAR